MANTLRFKRGLVSTIPTALAGEPLFTTDTFDLYIGNGTTNTRFQKYIASGTTSQLLRGDGSLYTFPLAISSPSAGQVLKYNGTSWVNDSDAGITGSGTTNYLPKFTGATTLGNSNLINDANGNLGLAITPSSWVNAKAIDIGSYSSFYQDADGYPAFSFNSYQGTLGGYFYKQNDRATRYSQYDGQHRWFNAPSGSANAAITYTQAMTLNASGRLLLGSTSDNGLRFQVTGDGYFSGSVGVGTSSPTRKLSVVGAANFRDFIIIDNSQSYFGDNGSIGTGTADGNTLIQYYTTKYLSIKQSGLERARLDENGNLGLGVVPSAWGSGTFGFDIGSGSAIWNPGSTGVTRILSNAYNNGTNYIYKATRAAAMYQIGDGAFSWHLAPSGTLNTAITFTQAMTLDASGNLGVGTTNPLDRLHVNNGDFFFGNESNVIQNIRFRRNAATVGSIGTYSNQIEINGGSTLGAGHLAITNGGNVILGFTGSNTGERLQVNGTMRVSGASTITGNLTVDTETLFVDAANNFVGVGTTTPAHRLHVISSGTKSTIAIGNNLSGTYSQLLMYGGLNKFNWSVGAQYNVNNAFEITPSTAIDGTTFSTPALTIASTGAATFSSSVTATGFNGGNSVSKDKVLVYDSGTNNQYGLGISSGLLDIYTSSTGGITFNKRSGATFTETIRIHGTGNMTIGGTTTTDTNELLQVNGTMRVSGASTFGGAINTTSIITSNTYTTAGSIATPVFSDTFNLGNSGNLCKIQYGNEFNNTNGSYLRFIVNSASAPLTPVNALTLFPSGAATFSSTAQAAGFITSGGDGYAVINSASNTVTALRPTGGGTNIMSTNSNGLHIAVGTQAAGDLILATNNTGRIRLSSDGFFSQGNGTNPSASITDSYIQYSADVVAGNAAPHFRTENGAVIKIYQETTAVGSATMTHPVGTALRDTSTFDGYTLAQVVAALRNLGILQ